MTINWIKFLNIMAIVISGIKLRGNDLDLNEVNVEMLTQNWPEGKIQLPLLGILTYFLPDSYVFLTDEAESDGYLPRPLVTLLTNGDLNKPRFPI